MMKMKTIDSLRRRAEIVRDETRDSANTANRVGQLLIDMIENGPDLSGLDELYLRKDKNDTGSGFYTWERGFQSAGAIHSMNYKIEKDLKNYNNNTIFNYICLLTLTT